jgi:nucleoside-diphosphate-sugar epimerase
MRMLVTGATGYVGSRLVTGGSAATAPGTGRGALRTGLAMPLALTSKVRSA